MHLLKNFGTGGGAANLKTGSTGGAKSSYFSSLNLAYVWYKLVPKNRNRKRKKNQRKVKAHQKDLFLRNMHWTLISLQ